ncbi:thrombospondin type 3 repeat-containing protein [Chryseobacterium sp. Marseille-Q3244]|uniref:thrombospondin type 3 repeat-containing protein n=1 Tax=Chryseobacterium sp. Marseille-Q3244 TaxID=2758092 RepID=UPI00202579FF|nr:thrombospondin type 3 repeat-containing protein [Chryseobacterium sp. Marseille-Q3244]
MKKITFLLIFSGAYFYAQNTEDKEVFKKCRKEFNKKICLADEDKDSILFYLDKCPTESGPIENLGCPWPDTDKDGILDKDDACPAIPGLPELNGCPSKKNDCKEYREKANTRFQKFKTDYADIEAIYDKINTIALDYMMKGYTKTLASKSAYIYIKYISNNAYFDEHSCYDGTDPEYNFLITKFWNKNVLEYAHTKYGKDIYLSTKFPYEDLNALRANNETLDYIIKYYDQETMKIKIPGKNKSTIGANFSMPIIVTFINPYLIKVEDAKKEMIISYEYKDGQWKFNKQQPDN